MRAMASIAAVVLLAVPAVEAQGDSYGEWLVAEGPHFVEPETGALLVDLLFRYHCDMTAVEPVLINISLNVTQTPPYATPVLNPSSYSVTSVPWQEDWCGADGNYIELPIMMQITTTRQAPAYVPATVHFNAMVEYDSEYFHTVDGPYNETVAFESTYFPGIEAIPQQTLTRVAPGEAARFFVDVTNYANGPTVVHAAWRPTAPADGLEKYPSGPPPSDFIDVVVPGPFVLESLRTHGAAADEARVAVQVTAPSTGALEYTNQVYSFAVDFSGADAGNRSEATDNETIFLSLQVQGTGVESPAPAAVVGFVALAVALVVVRRRQ